MSGFAIYETNLGYIKIGYEDDFVIEIKKIQDTVVSDFGVKTALSDQVYLQLVEYFIGKRKAFDFPYEMRGTDFQKKVWRALCDIPYGETRSYKDIAKAIGNEKASRAVGMANNKNPIPFVVPCHRVIGASGKLVGYAYGLSMKGFLLEMEAARTYPNTLPPA
ncbi:MAG: methylated-DNA--[protein]-cysteine S-methyltransferase [Lachnospiraceae bacterium]